MTTIKRRYKVWVPGVRLFFEVDATITKKRLIFEVNTEGLLKKWRIWAISPDGAQAIGDAVAAHHRQVEMEAWAKLTKETPDE